MIEMNVTDRSHLPTDLNKIDINSLWNLDIYNLTMFQIFHHLLLHFNSC